MAVNPELLSRRQLLKAAAGGAVLASIPLIGERGRAVAQENQRHKKEARVVIPNPETPDDRVKAFTSLVNEAMKPEGLELLGMDLAKTIANEKKLRLLDAIREFTEKKTTEKVELPEKPGEYVELTKLLYTLNVPGAQTPFSAWYQYDEKEQNAIAKFTAFNICHEGELRKEGDEMILPYETLQSFPEKYFQLPDPASMEWRDEPGDTPDSIIGIRGETPNFIEKDGLLRGYSTGVFINGMVYYGSFEIDSNITS